MNKIESFLFRNLNPIVLCIALLCLYAILQIRLDLFWSIGTSTKVDDINAIIEGLSYSYLAAALFYLLTMYLPALRRSIKLDPVIQKRVEEIGRKNIRSMLFEFARGTGFKANWKTTTHTEEILKSKNWDEEVPMFKKYNGVIIHICAILIWKVKTLKKGLPISL